MLRIGPGFSLFVRNPKVPFNSEVRRYPKSATNERYPGNSNWQWEMTMTIPDFDRRCASGICSF